MAASVGSLASAKRARTELRRFARAVARWIDDANNDPELPTFASTVVAAKHGDVVIVAAVGAMGHSLTGWVKGHGYVVQDDPKKPR